MEPVKGWTADAAVTPALVTDTKPAGTVVLQQSEVVSVQQEKAEQQEMSALLSVTGMAPAVGTGTVPDW